jgi:hypothetical protein
MPSTTDITRFRRTSTIVSKSTFGSGDELGQGGKVSNANIVMGVHAPSSAMGQNGIYVDTGAYMSATGNGRLYTDTVSWCVAIAAWDGSRCVLAHMSPGQSPIGVGILLKEAFGSRITPKLRFVLVTMAVHLDGKISAIGDVMNAIDVAFPLDGWERAASKTTIVTGYCGIDWDQYWTLAVQTYGAFLFSNERGHFVY